MTNPKPQTPNSPPLLSIITVNFNNCVGLIKTLESVISQTWQDFEYIVIDGGSTDDSNSEIEKRAKNIDYWVSEPDGGIYQGMNKGIAKATGEYVLFLNSGDYLNSAVILETLFLSKAKKNLDLICFDSIMENRKIQVKDHVNFSQLKWSYIPHNSTFIKRELFYKYGLFSEDYLIGSDAEWYLRLFKDRDVKIDIEHSILTHMEPGGISQQKSWQNDKELIIRRWKYFRDWKFPIWLFREKLLGRWPPNYD